MCFLKAPGKPYNNFIIHHTWVFKLINFILFIILGHILFINLLKKFYRFGKISFYFIKR